MVVLCSIFNFKLSNLKGLLVLAHLLRNGSDRVRDAAQDHLYDLRTLENYQCIDERGRDQGASGNLLLCGFFIACN